MLTWRESAAVAAVALVIGSTLYIRLRWHRSPRAYRAMLALATCYFLAGGFIGAWALHLATSKAVKLVEANPRVSVLSPPSASGAVPFRHRSLSRIICQ
jgi:hypothetical protein